MANHLYGSNWTAAREDQLRDLWSTSLSAREIAAAMGGFEHTPDNGRNAVLGKAHRMRLPAKPTYADPKSKQSRDIDREHRRQASKPHRSVARKNVETAPPKAPEPFAGSRNIPFDDLRGFSSTDPNQCRFIEGPSHPFLYCGTETLPGKPYCAHHHAIAHAKALNLSKEDRARRAKQATRNWFATSVKLTGIPAEAA